MTANISSLHDTFKMNNVLLNVDYELYEE